MFNFLFFFKPLLPIPKAFLDGVLEVLGKAFCSGMEHTDRWVQPEEKKGSTAIDCSQISHYILRTTKTLVGLKINQH